MQQKKFKTASEAQHSIQNKDNAMKHKTELTAAARMSIGVFRERLDKLKLWS
jgi:hypothetical protein